MGKNSKKGGKKASPTGTASAGASPVSHSPEPKSQVEGAPPEPEPLAHANGGASRTECRALTSVHLALYTKTAVCTCLTGLATLPHHCLQRAC